MSFGHALYYPRINLADESWLKCAFLYWNKISRIVPSSISPSDSEAVMRMRRETGFIEDYWPESSVIAEASGMFSDFLPRIISSRDFCARFKKFFHNDNVHVRVRKSQQFREDERFRRECLRVAVQTEGIHVHIKKCIRD